MTEEQLIELAAEIFGPAGYDIGGDSPSLEQLRRFAERVAQVTLEKNQG